LSTCFSTCACIDAQIAKTKTQKILNRLKEAKTNAKSKEIKRAKMGLFIEGKLHRLTLGGGGW
jgi:hypothetical protein